MTQVWNRDCMEAIKEFPDKFFDLAIVDPPYGIETRGNAQDRFNMGKDLTNVNDNRPDESYFYQMFRVSKNQIVWGYNHLSDLLPTCREFIFWYKRQPVVTFSDGELAWTSFQKTARCFDYPYYEANLENRTNDKKIHPTQKPIALYKWLLKNYAKEGDKILDTHGGSMSSVIACLEMGFEMTCFELDTDYFNAAKKRIEQYLSQQKMFDTHQEVKFYSSFECQNKKP